MSVADLFVVIDARMPQFGAIGKQKPCAAQYCLDR
jgi:hypothetical protein